MLKLKTLAVAALIALWSSLALAQTSPGLTQGQKLTPAQWNALFASKQDYPVSTFGPITPTTVNGLTITPTTGTLTIVGSKVLTIDNSLSFVGTDATTMTFPTTSATLARTDTSQTFTGVQSFGTLAGSGTQCVQANNSGTLALSGGACGGGGTPGGSNGQIQYNNSSAFGGTATGTGVLTALGVNTGSAGAFVVNGGQLGSPSTAGTLPSFTESGTITGGSHVALTGLGVRDTSAAFDVTIAATSSTTLSAGRTLTIDVKNVAHTLALGSTANTITFPSAASYTLVGSNDSGTVTNTMLVSPTILVNGTSCTLGGSCSVTGTGSPGGSTTQLQYNNAGAFAGITGATTNGTVVTLTTPLFNFSTGGVSSISMASGNTGNTNNLLINNSGTSSNAATVASITTNLSGAVSATMAMASTGGATPTGSITSGSALTGGMTISAGAGALSLTAATLTGTTTLSGITGSTQCLQVNSSGVVAGSGAGCGAAGTVASVGNAAADTTLTIAGTGSGPWTGAVTVALNLGNANTWTAVQTISTGAGASLLATGSILSNGTGGIGYATGAGGTVTQATNRATGVTINKLSGEITLASAAGVVGAGASFTVTNSTVAATDKITINFKSTTNIYNVVVASISNGSFVLSVIDASGTATDTPVIAFQVLKGANT